MPSEHSPVREPSSRISNAVETVQGYLIAPAIHDESFIATIGASSYFAMSTVHARNLAAGWWHNRSTGERLERNFGEICMLIVSEVCEAADGYYENLSDDKLPKRQMLEVELADALIRILDTAGGFCPGDFPPQVASAVTSREGREARWDEWVWSATLTHRLLRVVMSIRDAMEAHRRGRDFAEHLATATVRILEIGIAEKLDLCGALADKLDYNAIRADHTLAARNAPGGKQY